MQLTKGLWAVAFGLVTGAALLAAPPTGDSSPTAAPQRPARVRLTRPWSQLTDLTDAEKTKILDIHRKAEEQVREVRAKEHADILALLTDEQKKEVTEIEAKDREQRRNNRRSSGTGSSGSGSSASAAQTPKS